MISHRLRLALGCFFDHFGLWTMPPGEGWMYVAHPDIGIATRGLFV